jgi:hypothetical protein
MKKIRQRKRECEEARMALAQAIARHPLRRQWEAAVKIYGKSHQETRELFQRMTAKIDALPEWIAYQDAWLALHQPTHPKKNEGCLMKASKESLKGKKGAQNAAKTLRAKKREKSWKKGNNTQ